MVNLTRIYTRTGDDGSTRLSDNSLTQKIDPRVEAYGDVDEANSLIGVALAQDDVNERIRQMLTIIQNELFDVGADLSNPVTDPTAHDLRIIDESIDRLESWCDELGQPLESLRSFVLPGGNLGAAHLHVARAVVRRAERRAWACANHHGLTTMNPLAIRYLNRLSDLLFIMARAQNGAQAEVLWVPGTQRG